MAGGRPPLTPAAQDIWTLGGLLSAAPGVRDVYKLFLLVFGTFVLPVFYFVVDVVYGAFDAARWFLATGSASALALSEAGGFPAAIIPEMVEST